MLCNLFEAGEEKGLFAKSCYVSTSCSPPTLPFQCSKHPASLLVKKQPGFQDCCRPQFSLHEEVLQ